MNKLPSQVSDFSTIPEPELLFSGDGQHKHPLIGLFRHGPYSLRYGAPNALRIALLAPQGDLKRLRDRKSVV